MLVPELDHDSILRYNEEDHPSGMNWLHPGQAAQAERLRRGLLAGGGMDYRFNRTKPVFRRLSPGCSLCGEGAWSCLFINNLCNAGCFFCPTNQDNRDEPGTSTLTFSDPEDYADYLGRFGFRGASISGGEPLLGFDRTLSFVTTIKERLGDDIYLWMYTNGTLLTRDRVRRLADAGLDEIRFNIVATGYDLSPVRLAAGVIPAVTVEIPAVPDDVGIMKEKLEELSLAGVSYLNLHQIRCTAYNRQRLADRGYTFLHGPQVGILESELAALELMSHARKHGIDLGINYCSLIYRHRFQSRSSRRRWAPLMAKPFEEVTGAGLIRALHIEAGPEAVKGIEAGLISGGADPARWSVSTARGRITLTADLLRTLGTPPDAAKVSYALATVRPGVTYHNPFRELRLASGKKIVIERGTVYPDMELGREDLALFMSAFLADDPPDTDVIYGKALELAVSEAMKSTWQRVIQAEALRSGLLEYY